MPATEGALEPPRRPAIPQGDHCRLDIDAAELGEGLQRVFLASVPRLGVGIGALFVVAAVGSLLLYPGGTGTTLALLDLGTAGVFVGLGWWVRRSDPGTRWVGPICGLMVAFGLVSSWVPALVVGDAATAVWLVLLVVGAGVLLLSTTIVAVTFAAASLAWATLHLQVGQAAGWPTTTFAFVVALILGAAGHWVRKREVLRMVRLRALESRRRDELREEVETRSRVARALQASEAQLRMVVQSLPVILCTVDPGGSVTMVEGEGMEVLDIDARDLVGASIQEACDELPAFPSSLRRALDGDHLAEERTAAGRRWELRYAPLRDEAGRYRGAMVVAVDVTAGVSLERARDHVPEPWATPRGRDP